MFIQASPASVRPIISLDRSNVFALYTDHGLCNRQLRSLPPAMVRAVGLDTHPHTHRHTLPWDVPLFLCWLIYSWSIKQFSVIRTKSKKEREINEKKHFHQRNIFKKKFYLPENPHLPTNYEYTLKQLQTNMLVNIIMLSLISTNKCI